MLIAPSEPLPIKRLGQVSSIPERYGVDIMWIADGQKCGVQRKEIKDFIASVIDGRLTKEIAQVNQLGPVRALVLEGRFIWTTDGYWTGPVRWDRYRHRQALYTLQSHGIWIIETESIADTIEAVVELEKWTRKPRHSFARARCKVVGQWGTASSREFGTHLLQGLSNVGPELAERIYDHFGQVPWAWTVGEDELREVEGVGKVRARSMIASLVPQIDLVSDPAPATKPPRKTKSKRSTNGDT